MRFLIAIVLFLSVQLSCFGQKIFREGYVLKNNGDTLNGLVQFEANQKVDNICIFKRFDIANVVMYSPDMLKGFGYKNGNYYESFTVKEKNVFLECLLKGSVGLYSDGNKLLLQTSSDGLVVLKNNDVFKTDGTRVASVRQYLAQISKNKEINRDEEEITATVAEVLPIVKEINNYISSNYIVYNREYNDEMFDEATMLTGTNMGSYGFISALNFSSTFLISQTDHNFGNIPDLKVKNSDWSFGLFYNYKFSRMSTNWSFQSELHFQRQNNYFFSTMNRTYPTQTYRMDLFTDITTFKMPLSIRYSYKIRNVEPFVNLGLILNYSITNYSKALLEAESTSNEIYTYYSDDFGKKVNYISKFYYAGIGLKYKVLTNKYLILEGRYLMGQGNIHLIDFDYNYAPTVKLEQNVPKFQLVIGIGI